MGLFFKQPYYVRFRCIHLFCEYKIMEKITNKRDVQGRLGLPPEVGRNCRMLFELVPVGFHGIGSKAQDMVPKMRGFCALTQT